MRKIILALSVVALFTNCKDDKTAENVKAVEITQEGKDASYAIGADVGKYVDGIKNNPAIEDSIIMADFEKGIKDYLDNAEKSGFSYEVGIHIGQRIKGTLENEAFKGALSKDQIIQGMKDFLNDELKINIDSAQIIANNFYEKRRAELDNNQAKENAGVANENKIKGQAYLAKIKEEGDVKTTESGLAYKVIKEGKGESPTIGDVVYVKYTGKTIEGKVFDSTDKNGGNPAKFPLQDGGLIKGWIEALQLMKKGGEYTLYVPSELGYGDRQAGPDIAPGETLIFDMELVDVEKGAAK